MPKYLNGNYVCDCVRNYGGSCSCTTAAPLTAVYGTVYGGGGGVYAGQTQTITLSATPYDQINDYRIVEDAEILKLCDTLDLVGVMDSIDVLFKLKARFFLEMGFVRWIGIELPEKGEKVRFNVDRLISLTNPTKTEQPLEKQVLFG